MSSASIGFVVMLGACGGSGAQSPTATVGPTDTATAITFTPTPVPAATVGKIAWTSSVDPITAAPGQHAKQFGRDAQGIYAVVNVTNLPAGAVLAAIWTYNGESLTLNASSVIPSTMFGEGYVQFHLQRDQGTLWPAGTFAITISLDGKTVQTASVDVVDA